MRAEDRGREAREARTDAEHLLRRLSRLGQRAAVARECASEKALHGSHLRSSRAAS
jgi:hypothetical protein